MSEIIERLRAAHRESQQYAIGSDIFKAAAEEIERLQEIANEALREAAEKGCKLHTAETNLSNAKALLEAFVIAMRSGATTEDILETVRDGVGLTKETPKP